jgi:hypothetical protein
MAMDRYVIAQQLKVIIGEIDHTCGLCKIVLSDKISTIGNINSHELMLKIFEKFKFTQKEQEQFKNHNKPLVTGLDYLNLIQSIKNA